MRANAIHHEGFDVAKALNKKGIAAFVLKYRLVPIHLIGENEGLDHPYSKEKKQLAYGHLDALNAIAHVRENALKYGINPYKIGIMGFSFKANTNDTRESPAIQICKDLIEEGADLRIYDPKVNKFQIEKDLEQKQLNNNGDGSWTLCESIKDIAIDADAIVIATEWEEFKNIDWRKLFTVMRKPCWIFDTRNIINPKEAKSLGFNLWKLGNG
mgnify:CR=1 FL=1